MHTGDDGRAKALKVPSGNVVGCRLGGWLDLEEPTGGNANSSFSANVLGSAGGISPNEGDQLPSENRPTDLQDTASTYLDMDDITGTEMSLQVVGVSEKPTSPSPKGGASNDLVPGRSGIGTSEVVLAEPDAAAHCHSATTPIPTEHDTGVLTTIGEVGRSTTCVQHENNADASTFDGDSVAVVSAADNGAAETTKNLVPIVGTQTDINRAYSADQDMDDANDGRCSHDMPYSPRTGCSEPAEGSNNFGSARSGVCNDRRPSSGDDGRASPTDLQVARAVMEAAQFVAQNSGIPAVSEAATLVAVLVKTKAAHQNNSRNIERRTGTCRSILLMLERAGVILGEVGLFK